LERMHHEDGASWAEIAAGLAVQGVTQGASQPLTGRRLTSLMHNIGVRAEKLKSTGTAPGPSQHVPNLIQKLGGRSRKTVSLAPEMSRPRSEKPSDQAISEEEIRRAELSKHAHVFKALILTINPTAGLTICLDGGDTRHSVLRSEAERPICPCA
jgi:hypothetical protein